jgi:hypothetical protein
MPARSNIHFVRIFLLGMIPLVEGCIGFPFLCMLSADLAEDECLYRCPLLWLTNEVSRAGTVSDGSAWDDAHTARTCKPLALGKNHCVPF